MAHLFSGSVEDFDALVYGQPHPGTVQFIQNSINSAFQTASDAAKNFFSKSKEVYQHFYSEEAMRRARAALERAGSIFVANDVRYLQSLSQLRTAKETMQRYIMADPYVRGLYFKQQIEGFAGYYHDNAIGLVGDNHEDYMRVMDGVVEVNEKDHSFKYSLYYGYDTENENKLDLDQQVAIRDTWSRVRERIKLGQEDPTSVFGSLL